MEGYDPYTKGKMQIQQVNEGGLQITVRNGTDNGPVENALVRISYTGEPDSVVEEARTDISGQTPVLKLKTPLLEYSMEPAEEQPYAEHTVQVQAEGFENKEVAGTDVLPQVLAQQPVVMNPVTGNEMQFQRIVIPPHLLFGQYPPKIQEPEIKPIKESGEIVLSRVVIPEYVVVHDGPFRDASAPDYYVRYRDYIKNVASSEIYATWPEDNHSGKCAGDYVLYYESCVYRMIPESTVIQYCRSLILDSLNIKINGKMESLNFLLGIFVENKFTGNRRE